MLSQLVAHHIYHLRGESIINEIQARHASEGIQILGPRNDYSTVKHGNSLAGAAGFYEMRSFKKRQRGRLNRNKTMELEVA